MTNGPNPQPVRALSTPPILKQLNHWQQQQSIVSMVFFNYKLEPTNQSKCQWPTSSKGILWFGEKHYIHFFYLPKLNVHAWTKEEIRSLLRWQTAKGHGNWNLRKFTSEYCADNLLYNFAQRASASESRQQGRALNFSYHTHDNTSTPLSVIFC